MSCLRRVVCGLTRLHVKSELAGSLGAAGLRLDVGGCSVALSCFYRLKLRVSHIYPL